MPRQRRRGGESLEALEFLAEQRSHEGRSTKDELETEGYNKEEAGREFIHPAKEELVEEDPGPDVGIDADKCRG
ncbi:hypothetical protein Peur_069277 [Populus x canadensis]